jgi:hypothetical protein
MHETRQLKKRKGVTTMNQSESDQIWQHLQDNIEGLFNQTIADDVQKIEYKPPFVALLEMSSENNQNDQ